MTCRPNTVCFCRTLWANYKLGIAFIVLDISFNDKFYRTLHFVVWQPTLKLISAMKGSREKNGMALTTENRCVKWAPDVYDPPVTSVCHSVNSSYHYQRRSKSRKKEKNKKEKNKQKKKQKTKSKKGHQNSSVLQAPDLGYGILPLFLSVLLAGMCIWNFAHICPLYFLGWKMLAPHMILANMRLRSWITALAKKPAEAASCESLSQICISRSQRLPESREALEFCRCCLIV